MPKLEREEYIEQAHLFRGMHDRVNPAEAIQDLLIHLQFEILSTTKLPMAINYMVAELKQSGKMSLAMQRLPHYFEPFQTFLIESAEDDFGRFDMLRALMILEHEARFRAEAAQPNAMFFFQFETLCQNRLDYDKGLAAMANDSIYDQRWKYWILKVRHQIGLIQLGDLVYIHSQHYLDRAAAEGSSEPAPDSVLFGSKEGRIALANRSADPQYLFAALQRHLDYPAIPRPKQEDPMKKILPELVRSVERLEVRIKLIEQEQREAGIDLNQFMNQRQKEDRS